MGEVSLDLTHEGEYHVFSAEGFDSVAEAMAFAERLWFALVWAATRRHTAFRSDGDLRPADPVDDPEMAGRNLGKSGPVDFLADRYRPIVHPTGGKGAWFQTHPATITSSLTFDQFSTDLSEGLELADTADVSRDRLRTAIGLFLDHYYEGSRASKFITLVICLEVMAQPRTKHRAALELLARWKAELEQALVECENDDARFALESLRRELSFRRENSLRSRVRELARRAGGDEVDTFARSVVALYDLRGTLVHEGSVPDSILGESLATARSAVARILRAELLRTI